MWHGHLAHVYHARTGVSLPLLLLLLPLCVAGIKEETDHGQDGHATHGQDARAT
jgi:hypothetical protein